MPDIVDYIGRAVGWFRGLLRLLKTEKRIAGEDVGVSLENLKKLLEERIAKETDLEKRQALEDRLEELNSAQRGYYMARLKSALERSGLGPYEALVANGKRVLEPENKAKLTEAVTRLELLPPPLTADDFMASAAAKYALKQYEEALADYNKALKIQPDFAEALSNRGSIYHEMERYEAALADYNQALELKPNNPVILYNRGNTCAKMERYEEALADLNQALEIKPDDPAALNNRGSFYHEMERYEEAITDYNQALTLKLDDHVILNNRGLAYAKLERYDDALADYNRVLEIRPDYPEALNNRGLTYSKMKRYEEAISNFDQSLKIKPDYPGAVYNKACLFSLMHKPKDAIAFLEKAIALDAKYRQKATADSDFDNIRDDPRFQKLIKGD